MLRFASANRRESMKLVYGLPKLKFMTEKDHMHARRDKTMPRSYKHIPGTSKYFGRFAEYASMWAGSSIAFILALVFVFVWAITGPVFQYSAHWEALVTEIPGVITFLLVFLIQNSQGREMQAMQLKL